ncbi:low molecular weight phosphatase family protein [Plantibacter sp. LMC-P-059a]|jgi:protein-tyrosine phosphatase|uniref:arsenate reductase/protein-tyrosine-phosphatase family protein n=1 Tax=Plantibacter sp. LMC-P-059a TaxID=3040297 RepID=UPI0025509F1E|nr:low molecular weight phosphatase family protein [Plantibacter sp. LMC-P-059a]
MRATPESTPTRILMVCTGNICRSPYAGFLLAGGLRDIDASGFEVRSAGTRALGGQPIDASSMALLGPLAAATGGFVATQLTAELIGRQDAVLTMTREQRGAVLRLRPDALRRTFTLREFGRLLDTVEVAELPRDRAERWRRLLPELAANRTSARIPDPAEDDVIDPYGQDEAAFREMARQIAPATERIIAFEHTAADLAERGNR